MSNATTNRLVVAVLLAVCATGCRNSLQVKVERVDIGARTYERPVAADASAAAETATRLEAAAARAAALNRSLDSIVHSFAPPHQAKASNAVQAGRKPLAEAASEASSLAARLRSSIAAGAVAASRVKDDLNAAAWFWVTDYARLVAAMDEVEKFIDEVSDPSTKTVLADVVKPQAEAIRRDQATPLATTRGFGGLTTSDIFRLDPSDPDYQAVLAADGMSLSAKPICLASADMAGDSSIMIVIESPVQARVFQVASDPAQLARNIGIITSKATSAALKFVTKGVQP